jgi:cytochrome c-type biogenesis protein CcmH
MGWVITIALALATGAALAWFIRDKAGLQFLGAALMLALAGYALQGRPDFEGRPKAPPPRRQVPETEFASMRQDMLGRFDRASAWLTMADGYQRSGDTLGAAQIIQSGLRDSPNDPDLWVGLGNALVLHANMMMTPAAQYAFQRAAQIAPDHPAPRFFYGLALAQGGRFDEAERLWRQLLSEAPAGAEYRQMVEERLEALQQARARGEIPAAAPAPPGGAPAGAAPTNPAPGAPASSAPMTAPPPVGR